METQLLIAAVFCLILAILRIRIALSVKNAQIARLEACLKHRGSIVFDTTRTVWSSQSGTVSVLRNFREFVWRLAEAHPDFFFNDKACYSILSEIENHLVALITAANIPTDTYREQLHWRNNVLSLIANLSRVRSSRRLSQRHPIRVD